MIRLKHTSFTLSSWSGQILIEEGKNIITAKGSAQTAGIFPYKGIQRKMEIYKFKIKNGFLPLPLKAITSQLCFPHFPSLCSMFKIEWLKVLSKIHRDYINNLELLKFEQGHLLTLKTIQKLIQTCIMERNSGSVKLVDKMNTCIPA